VWVDSIRNSSYVIGYEMRDDDKVYMRAKTTLVCFDFESGRPVRLPAQYRTDLETAFRD
jgi:acyl-CoA thioester hydrolase